MKLIYQMILGGILGYFIGKFTPAPFVASLVPLGEVYINLLKMVALPLIFFSLINGMTSLANASSLYKTGFKSISIFIITGLVASVIGISVGSIHFGYQNSISFEPVLTDSLDISAKLKSFLSFIFPNNFFGAFTNDSTIQVTILALLISLSTLALARKEKKIIISIIQTANKLFLGVIKVIMLLSPLSVLIFTAHLTNKIDKKILEILLGFLFSLSIAYLIQYLLLGIYIKFISRIPCLPFFIKSFEYQCIAMTTGSSKATLPYTIQIANKKLGISEEKASFVLPLGATINMDGLSIYLTLSVLFIVNASQFSFSLGDYFLLIFASSWISMGTAGIPGGALAVLPILLSIWNLPVEYLPLFIAIDPLINLFRSTLNITGDVAITLMLDQLQGGLEIEKYKRMEFL